MQMGRLETFHAEEWNSLAVANAKKGRNSGADNIRRMVNVLCFSPIVQVKTIINRSSLTFKFVSAADSLAINRSAVDGSDRLPPPDRDIAHFQLRNTPAHTCTQNPSISHSGWFISLSKRNKKKRIQRVFRPPCHLAAIRLTSRVVKMTSFDDDDDFDDQNRYPV